MAKTPRTSRSAGPPTRAERQDQTRAALIDAGRNLFARDGYHGANLEQIANEAGFSKGAVYSNFASKADLFLAAVDANIELMLQDAPDPFSQQPEAEPLQPEVHEVVRGFALATLEFIAAAARDPALSGELASRMGAALSSFTRVAQEQRSDTEELSVEEIVGLLGALEQGLALLTLTGITSVDGRALQAGMQRILDPGRAASQPLPPADPQTPSLNSRSIDPSRITEP